MTEALVSSQILNYIRSFREPLRFTGPTSLLAPSTEDGIFFLYQVNDKKWWLLFLCEQWGRFIIRTWVNLFKLYVLSRIILPIYEKPLSQLGTRQPLKNYIGANCSLLCLPFRKRLLWDSEISTSMNRMLHLTFPWKMCGKSTSSL